MKTTSLRLDEEKITRIKELSQQVGKGKSETIRELIDYGWEYLMLRRYKEGKISLSKLAKKLGKPITETIDILAWLGIESPVDKEEVLQGYETLKKHY